MAESKDRRKSTEKDRKAVEELILDYACKNYMDDVITAIVGHRGHTTFTELSVPNLRVVMGTVQSIVQREDVVNFDSALHLVGIVHRAAPELMSAKQYVKLTTGLKTKVLLHKLSQRKFDYADVCSLLNQYFPKSELKTSEVSQQECQLSAYQLRFRRLITRLMLSVSEREAYLRGEVDAELGPALMAAIQRLLRMYTDRVNARLRDPVIEQIVAEGPQSQLSRDLQGSQSDCMDQLLSASFNGPPPQDVLLSILKASWEEEDEEGGVEDDIIQISDDTDDDYDDGGMSAADIFDFPAPSTSFTTTPASKPTQQSSHGEAPSSLRQNSRDEAGRTESANSGPVDKPVQGKTASGKTEEPASYPCNRSGDGTCQPLVQHNHTDHLCLDLHSDSARNAEDSTCNVDSVNSASDVRATSPGTIHQRRLDVLDQQQTEAPDSSSQEEMHVPQINAGLCKSGTNQIVPDPPILQQTDPESVLRLNGLGCLTSKAPNAMGEQVPSGMTVLQDSPQQRVPAVTYHKEEAIVLVSSSSPSIAGKGRIYLSKNGPQTISQRKRAHFLRLNGLVESHKSCVDSGVVNIEDNTLETSETQVSSSSDSSQSLSDKSSTSVSLLSGLAGFGGAPKRPRSKSPMLTVIEDEEDMMGLTMGRLFENTMISEIDVYPVMRLRAESANSNLSSTDREPETIQETPVTSQTGPSSTSQSAQQDSTVSSSNNNNSPHLDCSSSGSQMQTTEVEADEEVGAEEVRADEVRVDEPSLEVEGQEQCGADTDSDSGEPEAAQSDDDSSTFPAQDVMESPPVKKPPIKLPFIRLKRLSQDSKIMKYLESSTLSQGGASVDQMSQSSDSEGSMVPDSDDEDSLSTSDSSSLPCIELRPDSQLPLVRRFPTLEQYLSGQTSQTEGADENREMRQCTVRLRRLEPMEIDALTKGNIFKK